MPGSIRFALCFIKPGWLIGRLAGREDLSGRRVFRYFQLWRPGRVQPVVRGLPDPRLEKWPQRRDLLAEQRL